ncbi:ubiquitin-conjugating enzyme E2 [Anoxynatronum sibiricum]|uniref:Ubiquitin-conjugating enzyme E2 n=1 Tax=Anoxynatronum sibiricum TaxID=210623 RepID=A0ABU9VRY1_9CLOT
MSARLRRLASDYDNLKLEFARHPHIDIEPISGDPPDKYLVTYKVKGFKLDERTGKPVLANRHQVEVYLHAAYPREKPRCQMKTPIFHPNFRFQVCIGDYWGAGERLTDIIIQIGDMIQYKNYNPKSPLNIEASHWARENTHLFPADNVDLWQPEPEILMGNRAQDDFAITLKPAKRKLEKPDDVDIKLW